MVHSACRLEVMGRVSQLTRDAASGACLIGTLSNGVHVIDTWAVRPTAPPALHARHVNCSPTADGDAAKTRRVRPIGGGHLGEARAPGPDRGPPGPGAARSAQPYHPGGTASLTASQLESYPADAITGELVTASCWVDGDTHFACGTHRGAVNVVSRRSRTVSLFFRVPGSETVRGLRGVPMRPMELLVSTESGAVVYDATAASARFAMTPSPSPRNIGAVAMSADTFAVANYDGAVLLYDARNGPKAVTVLQIPDQPSSIGYCAHTCAIAIGTVAGRVFLARGGASRIREQAFGTGTTRAPIRALAVTGHTVAAGDTEGRVVLIDASDASAPTRHWTAPTLFHSTSGLPWTATAVDLDPQQRIVWAAFATAEHDTSPVVALGW